MNEDKIEILDKLLLRLRKSANTNELIFDDKGHSKGVNLDRTILNEVNEFLKLNAPQSLYRYRAATDNDLQSIYDDKIWFSTFKEFNDPFENHIYIDLESIADDLVEKDEETKNLIKEKSIGKNHPKYVQYLNSIKNVGEKLKKELAMKSEQAFFACFSEVKSSLLMWAHYASSHKGICIEYNYKELSKIFGTTNLVPIHYTNDFLRIADWCTFIEHHEIFIKAVKRKSVEWSYEKEWRLIGDYKINLPYTKGELLKAPTPCAIYLGVNISSNVKARIREICKKKHINLYQMRISEKGYRLVSFKEDL